MVMAKILTKVFKVYASGTETISVQDQRGEGKGGGGRIGGGDLFRKPETEEARAGPGLLRSKASGPQSRKSNSVSPCYALIKTNLLVCTSGMPKTLYI